MTSGVRILDFTPRMKGEIDNDQENEIDSEFAIILTGEVTLPSEVSGVSPSAYRTRNCEYVNRNNVSTSATHLP